MKASVVIVVIVIITALGIISYSLGLQEDSGSQEIVDQSPPENEQPLPKGKNLSINLSESIGVEANP